MRKPRTIRKEKAVLIQSLKDAGNKNPYVEAGKIINDKYGKDWNEQINQNK